jgi:signal transduction histidine kinase
MNHEFRTPLSIILTSSELLERYHDRISEDQQAKHFGFIRDQISRLANVLDDILTISRAETVGLQLEMDYVNLETICEMAIAELQPILGEHQLVYSAPNGCKTALFDRRLIRQAVKKLVANAVKFSPPGSRIEVDLICQEHDAVIRVHDYGIGIPAADQEHLFDVFYRAQNVDERPGVGLGLAIVKHAARLHGGSVSVESTVGVGTTFALTLPLVEEEARRPSLMLS